MPSFPHSWLYVSDGLTGVPTELINGARLANNLQAANLCATGKFDNILSNLGCEGYAYQPTVPAAMGDAVVWLDAMDGSPTRQYAPNRGSGGFLLNGTLGATTAASTDDPLWLGGGEHYLYLPGLAGNDASVPNLTALQISGDIEIAVRVSLDDWTPAAVSTLVSKYVAATAGYEFQVNTDGTLRFVARLSASDITAASTIALPAVNGQDYWVKVTRVQSTGAVSFFYAPGGANNEPPAYNQLGTTVTSTTGVITTGSQILYVGERSGATTPTAGKFYRVLVRSAVGAYTPVNRLDMDFAAVTSQTSFTAAVGGTVTISRAATGRKSVMYQGRPLWLFGTDDFITIADHPLIDFAANESFTVVAVQRVHNVAVGAVQTIVADQSGAAANGFGLYNGPDANTVFDISDGVNTVSATTVPFGAPEVVLKDSGGLVTTDDFGFLVTAADAAIGGKTASELYVLGGVRDVTADTVSAYLDQDASVPAVDTTTGTLDNAGPLRVGGFSAGASPLDAEIMAVLIWRRALTATEMAAVATFYKSAPQLAGRCWTAVDFSAGSNPWYDSRLPESLEAYGFLVEDWTGLDGAANVRSSTPTGQVPGGAYYGPQSHNPRTWKLNVLLHGSTERGLNYLFRWLENRLLHCCGATCEQQFAWFREVCPSDPVTSPEEGVARAERVVLLEGPTWESPPDPNGGCFLRRVSFTLGAGDPCLYREVAPLAVGESTTSGAAVDHAPTTCATFAGDARQVKAPFSGPAGFGQSAPVVTISSPAQTIAGTRAGLPVMRIVGYISTSGSPDLCRATQIGELILEGNETSGYEIVVDMAKRKIRMRAVGEINWQDGSRLIGRAIHSGMTRWWSFGSCDTGFVVVEPAYTHLATSSSTSEFTLKQVTQWSTRIESATRYSCC